MKEKENSCSKFFKEFYNKRNGEVTHNYFFGENIVRIIRAFNK